MFTFVLDVNKQSLVPCHPAVARKILDQGKAAVFRRYPFTIILKEAKETVKQNIRLKIDPGSKKTGLTILQNNKVIWAAEIEHRSQAIRSRLDARRSLRRSRRNRKTRYRQPRFLNRTRSAGWLPPSIESRVANVMTWVNRLMRLCPITDISLELVKFDTQLLENPEISSVEYQQGELAGYEVREYLLEKYSHQCAYCGKTGKPLEVEHVTPKSRGGTNRISNLTMACHECNDEKDNLLPSEWRNVLLASGNAEKATNLDKVMTNCKNPLKDAAAVNITRWALYGKLKAIGLPIERGTGGRTKFNRTRLDLPKEHWLDAACVGSSTPGILTVAVNSVLQIKATGHGKRQRCITDKFGFPKGHAPSAKTFMGYQTGDIVRAVVPKGKYAGVHTGRIAIRHRPCFKLDGFGVHPKYLRLLHHADGYEYSTRAAFPLNP
jgi:5-methylcytosine-specific restriction endonuclease McrA